MTTSKNSGAAVSLKGVIGPAFYETHRLIRAGKIDEAVEKGGRASLKSSYVSVEVVLQLLRHPDCHALVTRQVADTMRDSVYAQILWAIDKLGLGEKFRCTQSPLQCVYLPTGQRILFRGLDDPQKIKSIKLPFGYIQYGVYWYSYASTPTEARQEARCCLAAIQGKHLCLPVAYDIEYEPCILRLTNAQRTALVEAFLGEVQDAGYYGILYASTDFIRNRLDWQALTCFDCWPAQYGSACTCPLPHGMWQYSSANALGVPGFGSHLDCNKVYKDYEQIMIQAGLQGHKTAEPDADTKPNALPLQKLTIGPVSSGDALTLYKLAQGLGLVEAGLYKAERIGGQIMQILTIGPVSSGDAWLIMRKCAALELTDRGLYLAEYVTE